MASLTRFSFFTNDFLLFFFLFFTPTLFSEEDQSEGISSISMALVDDVADRAAVTVTNVVSPVVPAASVAAVLLLLNFLSLLLL